MMTDTRAGLVGMEKKGVMWRHFGTYCIIRFGQMVRGRIFTSSLLPIQILWTSILKQAFRGDTLPPVFFGVRKGGIGEKWEAGREICLLICFPKQESLYSHLCSKPPSISQS